MWEPGTEALRLLRRVQDLAGSAPEERMALLLLRGAILVADRMGSLDRLARDPSRFLGLNFITGLAFLAEEGVFDREPSRDWISYLDALWPNSWRHHLPGFNPPPEVSTRHERTTERALSLLRRALAA